VIGRLFPGDGEESPVGVSVPIRRHPSSSGSGSGSDSSSGATLAAENGPEPDRIVGYLVDRVVLERDDVTGRGFPVEQWP